MKTLLKGMAMLLLMLSTNALLAQNPAMKKQPIFKSTADRLPATTAQLEQAFAAKEGSDVNFQFRDLKFTGTIVSTIKRYENLYSVIIRSKGADNTLLSLSKRINDDKTITYVGRILNHSSSDGYELNQNADGTYTFHKIQTEELIQDY